MDKDGKPESLEEARARQARGQQQAQAGSVKGQETGPGQYRAEPPKDWHESLYGAKSAEIKNRRKILYGGGSAEGKTSAGNGLSSGNLSLILFLVLGAVGVLHRLNRLLGEEVYLAIAVLSFGVGLALVAMGGLNLFVRTAAVRYSGICYGLFFGLLGGFVSMYYFWHVNSMELLAVFCVGILLILGLRVYLWIRKPFG